MVNDIFKQKSQQLIDALAEDMKFRAELERAGILFDGYHPEMRVIHEHNAQLLEDFLNQYDWPYPSKYGHEIHETAWVIAIHAISKPALLKKALHILKAALDAGEPVANEYAKLYDRIELYEGRQQVYWNAICAKPNRLDCLGSI